MSVRSILCVDDSPSDLRMLETTLTGAGYVVATAQNGKQAVEAAARIKPDLVFMDVNMPEMDGFQATRTLSGSAETKMIPVVLVTASVLSGNRNFEARIHPNLKANFLASPPLVVAYAIAGTMQKDLTTEPLGNGKDGKPVYLRDIWPTEREIQQTMLASVTAEMFETQYADVFSGDSRWQTLDVPTGDRFAWEADSTYVRNPPYFDGMTMDPAPVKDIKGGVEEAVHSISSDRLRAEITRFLKIRPPVYHVTVGDVDRLVIQPGLPTFIMAYRNRGPQNVTTQFQRFAYESQLYAGRVNFVLVDLDQGDVSTKLGFTLPKQDDPYYVVYNPNGKVGLLINNPLMSESLMEDAIRSYFGPGHEPAKVIP